MSSDEEDEEEELICRLSHPAHPHTLSRRSGENPPAGCFGGSNEMTSWMSDFYYYCGTCDVEFHNQCHKSPRKMTHPFHPQHPLIFSVKNPETRIISDSNFHDHFGKEIIVDSDISNHGKIFDDCTWCEIPMICYTFFYRCSVCNFFLCPPCSVKFPLPTIPNPKSHPHSLIFFPRHIFPACDACGLIKMSKPSYSCFQCNYMVHKNCIALPRVIKLTRHTHRLFHTPFLPPTKSYCRLCYRQVDGKLGQYSCFHDDCSYIVHSKCATQNGVWDGKELEWEPEKLGKTEDIAPFKKVGDGLIKYFCHDHHLKLDKYDGVRDADKQCEACILHIDSRDFYNCMQCNFFLHEVCANLPRKLDHALHHHPLFLEPTFPDDYKSMDCLACSRKFTGFKYKCSEEICEDVRSPKIQVDVGCILVPDYFTHSSHEHPLFIPISFGNKQFFCDGCKVNCDCRFLECTICEFVICYKCATMPDKLYYKYDALPLSLCHGEVATETYWCEVCEEELDPCEWFYTSNKLNITIHSSCVFGFSSYMKSGSTFYIGSPDTAISVKVLCNRSSTRPICLACGQRCSNSVYFNVSDEFVICSFSCKMLHTL